ncbi:hypothetical protein SprV_0100459600 [Sparganum proliferum]
MSVRFASWFFLSALVVESLCTATAEEKKKIIQYHNDERENVKPSAANMQLLVLWSLIIKLGRSNPGVCVGNFDSYSDEMDKLAADWVDKCLFTHPDPSKYPEYDGVGQNLAVFSDKQDDIYKSSMSMWSSEKANYEYSTNNCTGVCGHYTQLVWAETTVVGCAWKLCPNIMSGYPQGYLVACQYKPWGNLLGAKPYVSGESCSQCAQSDYCVKNQCSKHKGSGSANKLAVGSLSILLFTYILN